MPQRVCPKCKNNLYNSSYYFCSFCGEVLSEDLILKPEFGKVKKHILSKENIKSEFAFLKIPKLKLNKHLIYVLVAVTFVLAGTYFVYKIPIGTFSFIANMVRNLSSAKINSPLLRIGNSRNIIYFKTDSLSEPFSFAEVTSYLPYETDLFIEINNLKEVSKTFSFNLVPFNNISEFTSKAYISHSLQDGKDAWITLLPVKKEGPAALKFADNFVNSYWRAGLDDRFLIITSDNTLFNLVKDIKSQKIKSLELNPQFQKSLENVPKSGSIMVVIFNMVGRKQFEAFSAYHKDQNFLSLMDEITKKGYNYFILRGYK